jgi:hypothetical protein
VVLAPCATCTVRCQPLTTSPPMLGCLKMYMLCTGIGRLKPRLRHTADTAGERVKDLAGSSTHQHVVNHTTTT